MNLHDLPNLLADLLNPLSQVNRPLRLRLGSANAALGSTLLIHQLDGTETLCGGLEYRLLCVAAQAGIPVKSFIGLPVEVQLVTDSGNLRTICGVVEQASEGESDGGLATYQLIVRDVFSLLDKTCNSRIFQNKNEIQITQIVLNQWRQANPEAAAAFHVDCSNIKTDEALPARAFTMQYNESTRHFLERLWRRRGISWFIQSGTPTNQDKPSQDADTDSDADKDTPAHTLVLFNDVSALPESTAKDVRYHRADGTEHRDTVTAWRAHRTLSPGYVGRQSWDYNPAALVSTSDISRAEQGETGTMLAMGLHDQQIDAPHAGHSYADSQSLSALRVQHYELNSKTFYAESTVRDFCVGHYFGLTGHAEIDTHPAEERQFVITTLHTHTSNNLPKELSDRVKRLFQINCWLDLDDDVNHGAINHPVGQTATAFDDKKELSLRFRNRFTCVRRGIDLVPAFNPRVHLPQVYPMSAIVVCPPGEEVHCDALGRVKIRFLGLRPEDHTEGAGTTDTDADSAWVRVMTNWAGTQWGMQTLPRAGSEVIIDFLHADCDKPIIVGSVHNGSTPPSSFSHVGNLPGNKALAGIKSRELQGIRYNQLRLDDTSEQISAQLASEHGHSQLNLGYLTHPRQEGQGAARGEGAELRSDQSIAIRGAQGIYLTADARLRAAGEQLSRDGLVALSEVMGSIATQLSALSQTHHADPANDQDQQPLTQLNQYVKQWHQGSNTAPDNQPQGSRQPIVAIDAPAGMLLGSQNNIAIAAQTNVDSISGGTTRLSAGRHLLLRAAQSISLFAHQLGMKLIAASGKLELQTHKDDIEITSAKRIVLSAADEIVLQAPKLTFISEGAQLNLGGGAVTYQTSGAYTIHSASFAHTSPGNASVAGMSLPKSEIKTDERFLLTRTGSGEPLPNRRYRVLRTLDDSELLSGVTDQQGYTDVMKGISMEGIKIIVLPEEGSAA
jgi:type VI secretion system secreted protein VgrG